MNKSFNDFIDIVAKLRSPEGCPWDREQVIPNYKKFFIEETYELVEAIDSEDSDLIKEELGDVLLLVVMTAQIAKEEGLFEISDVIDSISEKMVVRHPHVFADAEVKDAEEVLANWMKIKAERKQRKTLHERMPKHAPALLKTRILFKEMKHTGHAGKIVFDDEVKKTISFARTLDDGQLTEAILLLAKEAYDRDLDIEELLRQRVLEEADKYNY